MIIGEQSWMPVSVNSLLQPRAPFYLCCAVIWIRWCILYSEDLWICWHGGRGVCQTLIKTSLGEADASSLLHLLPQAFSKQAATWMKSPQQKTAFYSFHHTSSSWPKHCIYNKVLFLLSLFLGFSYTFIISCGKNEAFRSVCVCKIYSPTIQEASTNIQGEWRKHCRPIQASVQLGSSLQILL